MPQPALKTTLWIVIVLVLVGLGIYGLVLIGGSPSRVVSVDRITDADHVKGNRDAKATLIEYSDFQCPACGAAYPIVKQLETTYGDQLAIVYRHFPLRSLHQNAEAAARAAEAAGLQGKFWEMHDLLFEEQDQWSEANDASALFTEYAESLSLDRDRFQADRQSSTVKDHIASDYQSGLSARIPGTPTFFLNGKKIQNPRSFEGFKKLIDETINPT